MSKTQRSTDLTRGPVGRTLFFFFLPIAAGNLFQQFYNTADAIIIAKFVGTGGLAAVGGSASTIMAVLIGLISAMASGAGVVIAQAYGSSDRERSRKASGTAIVVSVILGAAFGILGYLICPSILAAMQTPEDTMADSVLYLRTCFTGMLFLTIYNMGASILRSAGDSRRPLIVLVICCCANIALDIIMVAVFRMGVLGVALATVFSQMISAVVILYYLVQTREAYQITFRSLQIDRSILQQMLRIGIPAAAQSSMYNVSNLIIQVALNPLGTVAVASWSMAGKIDGVYWSVSNAMGAALTAFVGQNYGAGHRDRIRQSVKKGLVFFMAATFALEAAILLFGHYGAFLLIDDIEVLECTQLMLVCFVPAYCLWTLIEIFSGALRGIGDTLIPVIITGLGICAFRLIWVALVFPVFHTVPGISLCYPASWALTAVIMSCYYVRRSRSALDALFRKRA